jgi:hypothetical protein
VRARCRVKREATPELIADPQQCGSTGKFPALTIPVGIPNYVNVNNIHMGVPMGIVAQMDDFGRPVWITLMILGFIFCWPVGLAILAYLIWSRRMGCWSHRSHGRWREGGKERMQETVERWSGGFGRSRTSGNRAFDEYRTETLRRLEDEQREFREFLDRLRFAKDKSEFDEFLADRRRRRESPEPPAQPQPQG